MGDSIFSRRNAIESARRAKVRELMKEYDETVYNPARKALVEDCSAIGHRGNGRWDFTIGGGAYQRCGNCGLTLYEEDDSASPSTNGAAK